VSLTLQLDGLEDLIRQAVADALAAQQPPVSDGFVDVAGAAAYLASSPSAIRSLVQRGEIPVHKTPNGRLLFDTSELDRWVRSG
jgi:excisionase family DNA binding protein